MPAPEIRGVGAVSSGIGTITPAYPTGTLANDLALMFIETTGGETPTCTGWTQASFSPQATGTTTNGTKLTILYRTVSNPASDNRTTNDPGNHIIACIITIREGTWDTTTTFDGNVGTTDATGTTSVTVSGFNTSYANTLVFICVSGDLPDANSTAEFSSWSNGTLWQLTERVDVASNAGNGGALGIATGVMLKTGAVPSTTVTAATSAVRGKIAFGVKSKYPARRVFAS